MSVDNGVSSAPVTNCSSGTYPYKMRLLSLFFDQDLHDIDILEVASQDLSMSTAQVSKKYTCLNYLFCFLGLHIVLFDTRED